MRKFLYLIPLVLLGLYALFAFFATPTAFARYLAGAIFIVACVGALLIIVHKPHYRDLPKV